MKKHIFYILLSVFLFTGTTACGDDDKDEPVPTPPEDTIDTTLGCKSPQDAGNYATFYKPQNGWVGDPMPFYNKADKTFYVFYLQDWRNGSPQDHPIYYTTTKDFGNFQGFYEAIPCGTTSEQDVFLGTGSFIEKGGVYYGFYTGHNGRLTPREKIMLATSPDMRNWTKHPEFTFEAPDGYDKNNFRDPCVYYDSSRKCYVMLITTLKNGKGCLARYTSEDLLNWTNIEPLTDFESDAEILECPDIFEMNGKWYLFFSRINRDQHRKTFYRIADTPEGPWRIVRDENGHHETLDGLFFYAGKTASDGQNRYISGWCSTGQRINSNNELDWAGSLITHKLTQQASGRLYPEIVTAVDAKYSTSVSFKDLLRNGDVSGNGDNFTLKTGGEVVFNRNASRFKISMNIDASQSDKFGIAFGACDSREDTYNLVFDLTENHWGLPAVFMTNKKEELNFTPLTVPENKKFNITIVAEKTICTLYINNQAAFTNRINRMHQNPWMIYAEDGTVTFSDVKINSH